MIYYDKNDKINARKLDSKNYPDALHFILAKKNKCDILTTENIKDFLKYEGNMKILHPKDLIKLNLF